MREVLQSILRFMTKRERRKFFVLTAGRAANGLFDLAGVMLLGYLTASVAVFLTNGNNSGKQITFAGFVLPALTAHSVPFVGLAVVFLFTAKAVLSVSLTKALAFHLAKVEARSAQKLTRILVNGPLSTFERYSRDQLQFAVITGSSSAFNGILNFLATIISEGFLFTILFASFIALSPWATLGLFVFLVLIAGTIQLFIGAKLQRASVVLTEGNMKTMGILSDIFSSFRELKVLGRGANFTELLYENRISSAAAQAQQTYLLGMPRYIIETALLAGIFIFGLIQSASGDIMASMSVVGVFLTGGFRIVGAMLPFQAALSGIKTFIPQAKTALDLLNQEPEQDNRAREDEHVQPSAPLAVEISEASYSYVADGPPALEGINLSIQAGNQVAFIGPSGAGKSTLADLLIGLITPTAGRALIEGQSATQFLADNSGAIAYVPQKTGIVSGTIRRNIALGLDESLIDDERVYAAIQMANLADFVDQLPEGLATDLGPQQDAMSGGQLQRLGLARAFYSNPGLIIMDEATSGLDAATEAGISATLEKLRGNVTVILIAHRLNTVQHADEVVVLEGGRITGTGTFAQILKTNPTIAEAARLMTLDQK